jgi:hypothetical protein
VQRRWLGSVTRNGRPSFLSWTGQAMKRML